jgi:hypothetical protein
MSASPTDGYHLVAITSDEAAAWKKPEGETELLVAGNWVKAKYYRGMLRGRESTWLYVPSIRSVLVGTEAEARGLKRDAKREIAKKVAQF